MTEHFLLHLVTGAVGSNGDKTMEKLSISEMETLYWNFIAWRDKCCDGVAAMSVAEFYKKYGLATHPAA
jgi:hypothetical protein